MGEEILRRARPALDAKVARRLSAALRQKNPTVYKAVIEVTSTARKLNLSGRLQLETLAWDVVMSLADYCRLNRESHFEARAVMSRLLLVPPQRSMVPVAIALNSKWRRARSLLAVATDVVVNRVNVRASKGFWSGS